MYYAIFHSHLAYLSLVWSQAKCLLNRITLLQKRAIRILHSAAYREHTCPLFHRYKLLKFVDLVLLENCILVNKCFNDDAFSLFLNHFKLTASNYSYCTRSDFTLPFVMVINLFFKHFQTIFHGHNLLDISQKK